MRRIVSIGIGPSPDMMTARARRILQEAPVILTYFEEDLPFDLGELLELAPRARVVRLRPAFVEDEARRRDIVDGNLRELRSIPEEWGVFLEIGDSTLRNPLVHHLLGDSDEFELAFEPGVPSPTAALARLGITARHYCVAGAEERELIDALSRGPCGLMMVVNISDDPSRRDDREVFELLRGRGYRVKFIKNCCDDGEEVLDDLPGDTYWTAAVAVRRGPGTC